MVPRRRLWTKARWRAYEIAWDDGDEGREHPASRVRAEPLTVDVDAPTARDARPPAVVTPQGGYAIVRRLCRRLGRRRQPLPGRCYQVEAPAPNNQLKRRSGR